MTTDHDLLVRIDERVKNLDDKVGDFQDVLKEHRKELDSLNQSRSWYRGWLASLFGLVGWLGFDKLFH